MRLLLTYTGSGKEGHPPLSLAYLSSYLRKYLKFNNIIIVDKVNPTTKDQFIYFIRHWKNSKRRLRKDDE